jgi:pimeloyl-ACP methyl ester carboxylesterase
MTKEIRDVTPATGRYATLDGMRTHLLEAGVGGRPLLLLHSGEYGGCAETSWQHLMAPLAQGGYHVVAPDWLGFGRTDKVVDFADPKGRRLRHIAAVIESLGWTAPAIVGNSMGGTYLAQDLASDRPVLSASAAVLVSGGGFVPDNDARRATLDYDLSREGMRRILATVLYSPALSQDEEYLTWRHELSRIPGAWQCTASARLRPPGQWVGGGEFGKPDDTRYERIGCPTLVVAGAQDPLRLPGYADELAARIPDAELLSYEDCGHMPNIEHPDRFAGDLLSFLDRRYARRAA